MGAGGVGDDHNKGKRKRNSAYSQDTMKEEPKRTRVHAQRKFAQGAGGISVSPQVSPLKEIRSRSVKNDNASSSSSSSSGASFPVSKGERPKTEDFLTFLCLRGTDLLPPELDFFNQASTASHNNESSDECSSDQDDVSKDPEVDKNGVARKSSKRLSAINCNSKLKKESSPSLRKRENVDSKKDLFRKTRSASQDSHSSPERKSEVRQTRSQGVVSKLELKPHIKPGVARKNGCSIESSEESLSDNEVDEGFDAEVDADEDASSRESSRRPMTRKADELRLKGKDSLTKLKERERRSTSRDSSVSKESIKPVVLAGKSKMSKSKNATPVKENQDAKSDKEESCRDETSKSPKDKRETKKKHKNKSKTSLKDLQNILLEEAKRKIQADVPADSTDAPQETSENSSKQPSCSPPDSDAAESDERITISQKTGYINVKPRSSVDQIAEEATVEPGGSPKRRNSGPLAGPGGKKIIKANERVPTPPRKILPKNDSEVASSESTSIGNRTNHLPVGVIGAAGLSNRMTHPVALSKSSPVSSSTNFSQPLTIQTTTSSQSKPVMTVGSMSQSQINVASMSQPPSQPTIIVPAGPNTGQTAIRMPIQVSAVPLQVNMGMRPTAGGTAGPGYSNMQGIPIITPTGMQFGIPVGAGSVQNIQNNLPVTMPSLPTQPTPMSTGTSLQIRPQQTGGQCQPPVVTVPTFIRSGYGYSQQPIVASVAPGVSSVASLPPPQTITMPSGTTIQYNVPSSSIKHNNPSTKISAVAQSPLPISTNSSPLVSPGPPTLSPQQRPPVLSPQVPVLSPQVPGSQRGSTTVTKTMAPGPQPPVLTPPVRQEVEPKARREILGSSSSPSSQHSPSMAPLAPQTMLSQQQHCTYPGPGSYHSPPYQQPSPVGSYHSPQGLQQQGPMHSPPYQQHPHQSPPYQQASPVGSYHSPAGSLHSPSYHGHMSPMYQAVSPQVQYSYQTSQQQQVVYPQQQHQHPMLQSPQDVAMPPQEPIRPPSQPQSESSSLHSPLLPSSASSAQMSLSKKKKESSDKKPESPKDEVIVVSDNRSESSECSSTSSTQKKKKTGDRMLKSKFGSSKARQTKTFDVEDNSSPYAFDFDNPESESPNIPFRKSSSPLKPPAMIKKSLMASKYKKTEEPQAHDDLKPTGSKHKTAGESQKSPKKKPDLDRNVENDGETNLDVDESKAPDNPEDTSSSDNETTYFIPLKNSSGQSFGVALKLGTDGPCGPNQKVIMTAKLVTDPATKPTKAKILGAKTTETSLPAREPASPVQSTSTPIKENMTPRKMMNANSSPVTYDDKSRIRRALSPDPAPSLPSTSSSKDTSFVGGKRRPMCLIGNVNTGHRFPRLGQHAQMMEAPTFRPSEDEFKDPLKYIQKIRGYAEQFGMCRIIPPSSFKPECNVDDDMRFTAYNQYINRMMSRSGQNSKETAAIKKYLETQNCDTRNHPLVGGLEVDLPALYHAVQSFGGLSEVIQKKKWTKIADYMRVARGTNINAAANKLDDVYVKWLLPYDTLSNVEREELIRLIEEEWAEKAEKSRVKEETGSDVEDNDDEEEDEDEDQEAVVKGKSTSLTQFYRVAKNLMSSIFRSEDPPHHIVEDEYWKIVSDKDVHLQVCQGSIDTGNEGYGFPIRNSQFSSHPWNLKQLTNNPRSVLRAMGKVMGVTQPTLHVGMLFTTGCWYRDPHGLPWVEFLHTGAPKIWYGIPDDHSLAFYTAMKQLVPSFCKNRKIWLPSDTTMVSPSYLVKHGVSVCRAVQQPGQFVVVFPRSYTSSICTGYNVSESVYYAPNQWLADVDSMFQVNMSLYKIFLTFIYLQDIRDSQEPMMFPIEKILFALASDSKATKYVLENIKSKVTFSIQYSVEVFHIKTFRLPKLETEKWI